MNNFQSVFDRVADASGSVCISIYLPTHEAGVETINQEDALLLKNQIKKVRSVLAARGHPEKVIEQMLKGLKSLVEDTGFWRKRDKGLAIFVKEDSFEQIDLPYHVEAETSVAATFEIIPLLPMLEGGGNYYLLALTMNHVRLYRGDRDRLEEIMVEGIAPMKVEDVVGTDFKPRTLQVRTSGRSQSIFHGHGEWKGEFKKEEVLKYLRAVDGGVNQILKGENKRLIIASSNDMFAQYTAVNNYPHLCQDHVDIDPEFMDLQSLHAASWNKVYHYFDTERQLKEEQVKQRHDTARTSTDLRDILANSIAGKVDTLFIQSGAKVWGTYDPVNNVLNIHENQRLISTSILNFLAKTALAHQGAVFLQAPEAMPLPGNPVNALYRY